MPYFKFVAEDGAHKVKSGRVSATSLEEARRKIESAGLTLLGLEEVTGTPAIEIRGVRGGRSHVAVRSEPIEQRLSAIGSGLEFFEEASESPVLPKILWAICGCGLLLGGYYVFSRPARKPNPVVASSKISVALKLDGMLKIADQKAPRDVVLTVEFPDLEMRIEREWNQLKHPQGDNSYALDLELSLLKVPKQCRVLVRRPQYAQAESQLKTLASGTTLHFETLTLNRLAERTEVKQKPVPSARQPIPAGPVVQMKPRKPSK